MQEPVISVRTETGICERGCCVNIHITEEKAQKMNPQQIGEILINMGLRIKNNELEICKDVDPVKPQDNSEVIH